MGPRAKTAKGFPSSSFPSVFHPALREMLTAKSQTLSGVRLLDATRDMSLYQTSSRPRNTKSRRVVFSFLAREASQTAAPVFQSPCHLKRYRCNRTASFSPALLRCTLTTRWSRFFLLSPPPHFENPNFVIFIIPCRFPFNKPRFLVKREG